jgi:metal-responsive CopG/Arc/MetJ family transcriptional regulator
MLNQSRDIERITISVPHSLALEADALSSEMKVSRSELYKSAMESFLAEQRRQRLQMVAAEMAEEYRSNRELTSMTALDSEDFS